MTREQRISEIMDELSCCRDVAEQMFLDEICDKYATDDVDVALQMFLDEQKVRIEYVRKPICFRNFGNFICRNGITYCIVMVFK